VELVRAVVIDCHIDDVFEYVANPLNDPRWREKVLDVRQTHGDGPGPGSVYEVLHRPLPRRPARRVTRTCVAWEPPHRIAWHDDDGTDVVDVAYGLESVWTSTRLTRRDDARLGALPVLRPLRRIGIGRDVGRELRTLKRVLERRR
jgi:uncharacterized protein YndB with AHSA1/START domain